MQSGNYNLIKNVVKPILDGLGELNKTLMTLNKEYVSKKQAQVENDPEEGAKRNNIMSLSGNGENLRIW